MARIAVVVQHRGDPDRDMLSDLKSRLGRLRLGGLDSDLALVCARTDPDGALARLRTIAAAPEPLAAWLVIDGGSGPLAAWAVAAHGAPVVHVVDHGVAGGRGRESLLGVAEVGDLRTGLDFCGRVAAWHDDVARRAIHDADERAAAEAVDRRNGLVGRSRRGVVPISPAAPNLPSEDIKSPLTPADPSALRPQPGDEGPHGRDGELMELYERELAAARTSGGTWKRPAGLPGDPPLDFSRALRRVVGRARAAARADAGEGAGLGHARITAFDVARSLAEEPDTVAADVLATMPGPPAPKAAANADRAQDAHDELEALLPAAKAIARAAQRPCLTTLDLLSALVASGRDTPLFVKPDGTPPPPDEWDFAFEIADAGSEYPPHNAASTERHVSTLNPPDLSAISRISTQPVVAPGMTAPSGIGRTDTWESSAHGTPVTTAPPMQSMDRLRVDPDPVTVAPRRAAVVKINGSDPDFETVERVTDSLLEGGVLGLATDTMYALAADATNPRAVGRLTSALRRDVAVQPVGVFIHSLSQLRHLTVSALHPTVERALENLWPGPLTVVVPRHPSRFADLAGVAGLGVRIPDHYATLALLSMLGRPMAVAAAHGPGTSTDAKAVAAGPGANADLLLDAGGAVARSKPTVISVAPDGTWRLLSEGAMEADRIAAAIGRAAEVPATP